MVGKAKSATVDQKKRMAAIKVLGCICCLLEGVTDRHATVHHIVDGGKRLGHDFTLGLCSWHHQAELFTGMRRQAMISVWGPSLAGGSKPFVERYGSELELLKLQDFILDAFHSAPWGDYHMPYYMIGQARAFGQWKQSRES